MRLLLFASSVLLSSCNPTKTAELSTLEKLDDNVVMPPESGPIQDYDRYYAKTGNGWFGLLQVTKKGAGKAKLTTEKELPFFLDGGCDAVNVTFDAAMKFVSANCNGDA